MESEYSGSLESVWGINTTSTTSSDRFSIVASPCCCCIPTPTTRIPLLHICSTSKPTGRTKSTCGTGSLTTIFCVSTVYSGTQTVPRPIASPPSGDPVIPVENLIDTSVSLNVTPNQTEFRAWINGRVHPSFGMKDTMVHYISRMLDAAKYNVADLQDLKLLKYDPKDHEQDPGDRQPLYYYLLRIPGFRRRAKIADHLPPAPQRANQALNLEAIEHVMISHTSNPGGASGILKEAKIAPSRLHVSDSNSFFSLGARKTGHLEWDMKEFARIIHNTWFLSKQQCSLVFVGTAWGTAVAVKEGGEQACWYVVTSQEMEAQYIIKGPKCGSPTPIAISWRPLHSQWQPFLRHDLQWCVSVFLDWFFCQVSYPEDSPSFPNWFKLFIKLFKLLLLKIQTPLKTPRPEVITLIWRYSACLPKILDTWEQNIELRDCGFDVVCFLVYGNNVL